jgi:Tfp pilus assembly protein PilX
MTMPHRLLGPLLLHAFRHRITATDADAGLALLAAEASIQATTEEWREAVSTALHHGLIRDPVCLPEGALQCHWRLALTPQGIEAARREAATQGNSG